MRGDAVVTKKVWERIQEIEVFKQLPTYFKARREKGAGTPFPRVPAPLHPWLCVTSNTGVLNLFSVKYPRIIKQSTRTPSKLRKSTRRQNLRGVFNRHAFSSSIGY